MRKSSVAKKVAQGLAGPECTLPTCLPTAIDLTVRDKKLSPQSYLAYIGYVALDETITDITRRQEAAALIYDIFARDLGLDSWKDFVFEKVHSARELSLLLRKVFKKGYSVIADIDGAYDCYDPNQKVVYKKDSDTHAVGLLPRSICPESFRIVSNWVPGVLRGVVTPDDLFELITDHTDPHFDDYPFFDANITIIPLRSKTTTR